MKYPVVSCMVSIYKQTVPSVIARNEAIPKRRDRFPRASDDNMETL